jgi:acetyl esterase/lipase
MRAKLVISRALLAFAALTVVVFGARTASAGSATYSYGPDSEQYIAPCIPAGPGPFPAAMIVHGGGWVGQGTGVEVTMCQYLAANGVVGLNTHYRLASPLGAAFWPYQVADLRSALAFIQANAATLGVANPSRICGVGFSAGGHLVSFLGADGELACVVDNYGPADMLTETTDIQAKFQKYVLDGASMPSSCDQTSQDVWCLASPVYRFTPASAPMLLMYGRTDTVVPPDQAIAIDAALTAAGVLHQLDWYPGGHSFMGIPETRKVKIFAFETSYIRRKLGY